MISVLVVEVTIDKKFHRRWVFDRVLELNQFMNSDPNFLWVINQKGAEHYVWDMMEKGNYSR